MGGDERARGTFERDEDIEGRHDVFETPQEDHVEPDHENLHDEEQEDEDVAEEEQEEEDPLKGLDGEGDVVDERVIDDQQQEEEAEGLEIEEAEGSEEELVAVHGKMERVNGKHFVMSTALLVVTG